MKLQAQQKHSYPKTGPLPRTLRQRLSDRILTRANGLPQPTHDYTITSHLRIPMSDGIELLADLYAPTGSVKGTILVQSPYGFGSLVSPMIGGVFAGRGYNVVLARVRGTFGSGGEFEPFQHEVADSADIVAWLRLQPWFSGRLGTHGGSYLGFTQWALLMDPPPELRASVISIGLHDVHQWVHKNGGFQLADVLSWSQRNKVPQKKSNLLELMRSEIVGQRAVTRALDRLPLTSAADEILNGHAPWYRDWLSHGDVDDPIWTSTKLDAALDRAEAPVLIQQGWQDVFLQQSLEQYTRLASRGVDTGLTIGPWTHGEIVTKGRQVVAAQALEWFDEHLAQGGTPKSGSRIRIFITGAEEWRTYPAWPPPAQTATWYPTTGAKLGRQPASPGSVATFTYDPADPTPTVGGAILSNGGYVDDRVLASRADTITFTSAVLDAPLEVIGNPVVHLGHATDNPHVDLFVRISEIDQRGRSTNITDGFARLHPGNANGTTRIELSQMAHRFRVGNRIRVLIAGGSHPHWARNLGTGEDQATTAQTKPSHRIIDLASSRVELPVVGEGHKQI